HRGMETVTARLPRERLEIDTHCTPLRDRLARECITAEPCGSGTRERMIRWRREVDRGTHRPCTQWSPGNTCQHLDLREECDTSTTCWEPDYPAARRRTGATSGSGTRSGGSWPCPPRCRWRQRDAYRRRRLR